MTSVFYAIGIIMLLIGGLWTYAIFSQPTADTGGYAVLGRLVAASPGFATIGTGLICFAIGTVLLRLAQISENTRAMAVMLEANLQQGS